jgi:senataxin
MEYYEDNLVADILGAKPAKLPGTPEATVQRTMSTYKANEPQAKAIIGAYQATGFVLIQGYGSDSCRSSIAF